MGKKKLVYVFMRTQALKISVRYAKKINDVILYAKKKISVFYSEFYSI